MIADRIVGLGICIVAAVYFYNVTLIPTGFLPDPVGSKTFPFILGTVAFICGILIILMPDTFSDWPPIRVYGKLAIATFMMYLFSITLRPYGFIIPALVTSVVLSYLIHPSIKNALLTGFGLSIGLFLILNYGLGLGLDAFGKF